MRRKTRFVCVSDTHAYSPSEAGFRLPPGDVLIHAGDLTTHGSLAELRKTMDWISRADYEVKIVVCGNHDITLDPSLSSAHGHHPSSHHSHAAPHLEDTQKKTCMEVVAGAPILFLRHESALVHLTRPNGPNTVFKVFGSPYSPASPGRPWAFGYDQADAAAAEELWARVPLDADVVITHTPPQSHCDGRPGGTAAEAETTAPAAAAAVGCRALRQVLGEIRPLLVVCGHVHEGRGYERIRWRTSSATDGDAQDQDRAQDQDQAHDTEVIIRGVLPPPGSRKQSLVDLTGKRDARLDNEGFSADLLNGLRASTTTLPLPSTNESAHHPSVTARMTMTMTMTEQAVAEQPRSELAAQPQAQDQVDRLRSARRETCVVNAAIVATSYPFRGGKRFNAPIVVDLELPAWQE